MIFRCLDVETTGMPSDTEKHSLMQIGWCDAHIGDVHERIEGPFDRFVRPARECTVEARAVHHIRDAEVEDGISPDAAVRMLVEGGDGVDFELGGKPDYYVAHNTDFERQFFGGGETPWICTYKTALRAWPEAPGHKLQELRYFLDVDADPDFDPDLAAAPHRAPDDAYVCAFVLRKILAKISVADAVKWSSGPALLHMCFLKKHKGLPWSQVPEDYLAWIVEKSDITDRDIRATAKFYLTRKRDGGKVQP